MSAAGTLPKVAPKGSATAKQKPTPATTRKSSGGGGRGGGGNDKLPKLVDNANAPPASVASAPAETTPHEEATPTLTEATAATDTTDAVDAPPLSTADVTATEDATPADDPTPVPAPTPTPVPTLTPEEFGERQQRNNEFLVACGKYHKGSSSGDLKRAQTLFNRGVDVDFLDGDGWSALFYAAGEGHLRLVQWLVEDWGASVDLRAPDNCTPLWTACFNGKRDVVSYLLRVGADDTIVGTPPGEPAQSPALAARRNRNPGIADFVDFEAELRRADPSRRPRQVARQMTKEEFRESMRSSPQFAAMDGGAA